MSAETTDGEGSGEKVTLTLSYVNDPIGADLIAAFEAAHPNIDIDASIIPFSDYVSTIRLTMASDSAPDIAQYNAGAMRTLIPAGELLRAQRVRDVDRLEPTSSRSRASTCCGPTRPRSGSAPTRCTPCPAGLSDHRGSTTTGDRRRARRSSCRWPSLDELEAAMARAVEGGRREPRVRGRTRLQPLALVGGAGQRDGLGRRVPGLGIRRPRRHDRDRRRSGRVRSARRVVEKGYIPETANGTSAADAAAEFTGGELAVPPRRQLAGRRLRRGDG